MSKPERKEGLLCHHTSTTSREGEATAHVPRGGGGQLMALMTPSGGKFSCVCGSSWDKSQTLLSIAPESTEQSSFVLLPSFIFAFTAGVWKNFKPYFLSLFAIFLLFCFGIFYFDSCGDQGGSMNEEVSRYWGLTMIILQLFLLLLCLNDCQCKPLNYLRGSASSTERRLNVFLPLISPDTAPQPFLPLLAPSPLAPLTNATIPKLSGLCMFNFLAIQSLMSTTSTDCHAFFAPLLANFICCPQLEATLAILVGQSSKVTNALALNGTVSKYCLSDIEHILVGLGAENNLGEICSMHPSNLTEGSCPVTDINEFESLVESSKLLHACEKIDPVNECCEQVCQSAILEAANRLALKASKVLSIESSNSLPRHSNRVSDCKHVVLRWLASKLDPSHAKEVLRGLSNCNVNKVCPLVFPEMRHVLKSCGNIISNKEECCNSMESYISHLQKQSLITNLQALDCATTLGMKLQKSNITMDVYSLCHVTLKDFSLQC